MPLPPMSPASISRARPLEAVDAEPDVQPVRADVDALDQQRHDARLLGGEEFVPQRVELLQGRAGVGLGDVVGMRARRLPRARHDLGLAEHGAELVDDGGLDLARRHAADRARSGAMLQHRLADVVAVEPAALAGVGRRERRAVRAEEQPLQQRGRLGAGARGALAGALLQDGVDLVPGLAVDDRVVLAGIAVALVDRLAEVGAVVQHPVEVLLVDPVAARACGCRAAPSSRASSVPEPISTKRSKIQRTSAASRLVDHQLAVLDARSRAAARRPSTCPSCGWRANLSRMRSPITSRSNWAKREQDVQRQPPHRGGGVERLGDRDEGHAVAVEHLDQLGEVRQRARLRRSIL